MGITKQHNLGLRNKANKWKKLLQTKIYFQLQNIFLNVLEENISNKKLKQFSFKIRFETFQATTIELRSSS